MAFDLIPNTLWNYSPFRLPSISEDEEDWMNIPSGPSSISISEDEQKVYVSAALPGVDEADIDMTFDKGYLWIKGEAKEEETDKKRKVYRRASSSFSYRVAVPGDVDLNKEPEANYKNGVMTVSFSKSPTSQPKKITVKTNK